MKEITAERGSSETFSLVSGGNTKLAGPRASAAGWLGELPHMLIGGVDSQTPHIPVCNESSCGVDWLTASIPDDQINEVVSYLKEIYEVVPEEIDRGRYFYDTRVEFNPYSCTLYIDSTSERSDRLHKGRFCLEITGSGLQKFTANGVYKLIYDVVLRFRGQISRIDLCYDDFSRRIRPFEIAALADDGNYTGFRTHLHMCKRSSRGEIVSDTLYFGSRTTGTGKMLRIYDKYLESGGKQDSIRYEVQFGKDKAKRVGQKLSICGSIEEFAALIMGLICGVIDFIDKKDKNLDRNKRLDWWQSIVDYMGEVKLSNPVRIQTVEKSVQFIERISATLSMIKCAFSSDEFLEFIEDVCGIGENELPERHKKLLDHYRLLDLQENDEVPF